MIQMLVQIDPIMARALERIAPARSRKRSEFIRSAIRKALLEVGDEKTRRAYEKQPDDEPIHFDAAAWSEVHKKR